MTTSFKNIKAVLFDLDGTLYIEDKLIGDVKTTLANLRAKGITVVYLSNNSSKTVSEYKSKLTALGIYEESDIIYSSLDASIDYLKENCQGQTIYPVCTKAVEKYLIDNGVKTGDKAQTVLLCFDREINYDKLVKANYLLVKGVKYLATHPDMTCPAEEVFIPDIGSFIKLLEGSSNRLPDLIIGKPSTVMGEYLLKRLGLEKESVLMVGDRLHTDIAFGVNNGFLTALVLSGESNLDTLARSNVKPTVVLNDVHGLNELI